MNVPRRLLATAVPVAAACVCAVPALAAASKVTVRVEGAKRTLLAPASVSVPSSGSITKGGAPAGTCPADTAAGALNAATHGDWNGTYDSGLGVEVESILGTSAVYAKGSYWEFFVNGRAASAGICDQKVKAGDQLLFAQVPAKGTEYPVVLQAPRTVRTGREFRVRTFYDTGSGRATRPVKVSLRIAAVHRGRGVHTGSIGVTSTTSRGFTYVTLAPAGTTYTVTASARGEIRSAPVTIRVVR